MPRQHAGLWLGQSRPIGNMQMRGAEAILMIDDEGEGEGSCLTQTPPPSPLDPGPHTVVALT